MTSLCISMLYNLLVNMKKDVRHVIYNMLITSNLSGTAYYTTSFEPLRLLFMELNVLCWAMLCW